MISTYIQTILPLPWLFCSLISSSSIILCFMLPYPLIPMDIYLTFCYFYLKSLHSFICKNPFQYSNSKNPLTLFGLIFHWYYQDCTVPSSHNVFISIIKQLEFQNQSLFLIPSTHLASSNTQSVESLGQATIMTIKWFPLKLSKSVSILRANLLPSLYSIADL